MPGPYQYSPPELTYTQTPTHSLTLFLPTHTYTQEEIEHVKTFDPDMAYFPTGMFIHEVIQAIYSEVPLPKDMSPL